jgi:hypothetical protein
MKTINSDIHVPEELRSIRGWLIWRFEQYPNESKPRKVPYWTDGTIRHGQQGSPTDRARLTTFAAARDAAARMGYAGVGFAPLPDFGYAFLDFDHCVGPNGEIPAEIEQIVARTYAEYSPSGKGIRAALKGNLGNHKSGVTPDRYGFETFSSNGFVTFTGNILSACELIGLENTVADVDQHVTDLCERRFGSVQNNVADPDDFMAGREPRLGLTPERMQELLAALDPSMGRGDWIKVGMALHHETEGDDTGFELWDEWSQDGDTYPDTEALRVQWNSFERRKGSNRRQVTMASVIKMAKEANRKPGAMSAYGQPAFPTKGARFNLLDRAGIMSQPRQDWLIKGLLPTRGLGVVFGPSQSGKSFLLLDMLAAIADGQSWFGYRVKRTHVTYVMLEGEGGLRNRVSALEYQHRREIPPNFLALVQHFDLSDPMQVEELGQLLPKGGVTAIDTLNRSAPGLDENAAHEMGKIIAGMKRLQELTEGLVICVHHTGKDASKGMRGHSSLHAALDMAIEVGRGDLTRWWKAAKVKDGADDRTRCFKLNVIDLGIDVDGDAITSCAIEPDNSAAALRPAPKGKNQKPVYQRLRGQLDADGWAKHSEGQPPEIPYERALAVACDILGDADSKRPRSRAAEVLDGLINGRHLFVRGDGVEKWLSLN